MDAIRKIWKNIKIQPDIWLFFLFLFTFTLSIRKVILYFPIQRTFNEYSGICIYISDILLVLTIILWLFSILCNNNIKLSIHKLWISCHKHKLSTLSSPLSWGYQLLALLLLILWSFLSIAWSNNQPIAIFRSIKLFEFYILYLYIIFRIVPRGTILWKKCSTWNIFMLTIIITSFIQATIGIIQVIIQRSIGLFWLKESLISPSIAGVAKIIIIGQKYIRAYGLFPHPNILGGFLLFSIIVTLLYLKLFHVEHSNAPLSFIRRGAGGEVEGFIVPRGTIVLYLILFIQLLALFLSFSKSAILGLVITLAYIYAPRLSHGMFHVEHSLRSGTFWKKLCSTWNNSRTRIAILSLLIVTLALFMTSPDLKANINQSLQERLTFLNVSRGTISANPLIGVGMGQFVITMQKYSQINLLGWQFQPVHNIFLLIWSELGIIGLILFIYYLYKMFRTCPVECSTWNIRNLYGEEHNNTILNNNLDDLSIITSLRYFKGILLGFLFIMFFDHYFWDIQQGSLMLWMVLGLIAGLKISCYNSKGKLTNQNK